MHPRCRSHELIVFLLFFYQSGIAAQEEVAEHTHIFLAWHHFFKLHRIVRYYLIEIFADFLVVSVMLHKAELIRLWSLQLQIFTSAGFEAFECDRILGK